MEGEVDESFLGTVPPVKVVASHCGSVEINVRFVTEIRKAGKVERCKECVDRLLTSDKATKAASLLATVLAGAE